MSPAPSVTFYFSLKSSTSIPSIFISFTYVLDVSHIPSHHGLRPQLGSHRSPRGRATLIRKCQTRPHASHKNARVCSSYGTVRLVLLHAQAYSPTHLPLCTESHEYSRHLRSLFCCRTGQNSWLLPVALLSPQSRRPFSKVQKTTSRAIGMEAVAAPHAVMVRVAEFPDILVIRC